MKVKKKESITHRPNLDYSLSLLENKSIWRGGEKVGFIVTVENRGKGKGEVDVVLSGDEYLSKLFGKTKSIGEIEPGKTKSEVFMVNLPTEPPTKEATFYIELKEKIWGESPTKKEVIRVSLLPAEKGIPKPPPEPLLPAPNAFANKRPNAYCLIVGIQDYQQVGKLKYSQKDAEAFKYYCNGVLGIPESNIKTLYDQQATGLPLITALRDWLGKKQNASMLVFYYSGHGAFNPDNPREDTFGYLVPVDG
ncbi:MAG: caspase family protein, partial [Candidatus Jordarchaeaceae archaeon]